MATPITFNSAAYSVPAYNDTGYAQGAGNLSSYLIAIASGTLQQSGGTFSLIADVNFGSNFGLLSKYYTSVTANPATAGVVRLAKTDSIDWRNNANSANLALAVNGSDQLTFGGSAITIGGVTSITGTANQVIASASTGAVTLSLPQDIATTSQPTFAGGLILSEPHPLSSRYGGTNNSSFVDGEILIGNISTGLLNKSTLTGTANQVVVTNGGGSITLSLPQSIATGSSPTFAALTLSSPLTVANGGMGAGTHTAYAVLAGGTTSTGAIQSVAGLGTSGQVLMSNGAGALPTFQTVAGSGTVNSGTSTHLAYYATSSNALSDADGATVSGAYTYSGISTFTAMDVHQAGLSVTGNTSNNAIDSTQALASNTVSYRIENTSTTGAAGSSGIYKVATASTGDPYVTFLCGASTTWAIGLDNDDGDSFKVRLGANPSTGILAIRGETNTGAISILGTGVANNAAIGYVGEYINSYSGAGTNFPTSGQYGDLTSISLTAGDWDVTAILVGFSNGTTTFTEMRGGISVTSGNSATGLAEGDNLLFALPSLVIDTGISIPNYRINISGSTTVYLKYRGAYTGTAPQALGRLSARRMR